MRNMASAGDAELILNVDATVARPTSSTAEPTMSDMAAQLQEAKAAALMHLWALMHMWALM